MPGNTLIELDNGDNYCNLFAVCSFNVRKTHVYSGDYYE